MKTLYVKAAVLRVLHLDQAPQFETLFLGTFDTKIPRFHGATSPTPPGPFTYVEYHLVAATFDSSAVTAPTPYTYTDSKGVTHTIDNNVWVSGTVADDFVIPSLDSTPPELLSFTPGDDATGVAVDTNIVLTFSETVKGEPGSIEIYKSDGTLIANIATLDTDQVTFAGNKVTINPKNNLAPGTDYYVKITFGAIEDLAGNDFVGITSTTRFNFKTATVDNAAPTLTSSSPADDAAGVAVGADIVLTFSEAVKADIGSFEIYKSDGTRVANISMLDTRYVSISGNTVRINPPSDLELNIDYYIKIAPGVIEDLAGNNYAGLTLPTQLNFRTGVGVLFTANSNTVNFNALTTAQKSAISANAEIYKALAGDDVVTLPDPAHFQLTPTVSWDTSKIFDGGAGFDVIKMPVLPSDYKITVELGSSWETTSTTLTTTNGNGLTVKTTNVEKATFAGPFINVVDPVNQNTIGESVRLINEAYTESTVTAENTRHWHPLAAIEMGMQPSNFLPTALGRYEFKDGVYEHRDVTLVPVGINDASCLVLTGRVDNQRTLLIDFKGSDAPLPFFGDLRDWMFDIFQARTFFYAKYKPLVEAIKSYLHDNGASIDRILVTGHSLGGAMVQQFVEDLTREGYGSKIHAFAFASIGGESSTASSAAGKLMHFIHVGDFANQLNAPVSIGNIGGIDGRYGTQVWINSNQDRWFGDLNLSIPEHLGSSYERDVLPLLELANDNGSTVFYATPVANALRDGVPWIGGDRERVQIAPGTSVDDTLLTSKGDNFVLAGAGDDTIKFRGLALAAETTRIIDGGAGKNRIETKVRSEYFDWSQKVGAETKLFVDPDGNSGLNDFAPMLVGSLYRVQLLVFNGREVPLESLHEFTATQSSSASAASTSTAENAGIEGIYVARVDGSTASVQTVPTGSTTVAVDSGFDYIDTGVADVTVTGTNLGDIIVFGTGSVTVNGGSANDIMFVKEGSTAGKLVINAGAGNDSIMGGSAADVLNGDDGDDEIDGGRGADQMSGGPGNDTFWVDDVNDRVFDGGLAKRALDTVRASITYALPAYVAPNPDPLSGAPGNVVEDLILVGSASINGTGNALNNNIAGNSGNNVLDGGAGADFIAGYGGNDWYFVDNVGDRTIEAAAEGTDRVFAAVSYALATGESIETLSTTSDTGTGAINLTGNEIVNVLIGNAGANRLDGGGAADVMAGYGGDDWYFVDSVGDRVVLEGASDGTDRVYAGLNYTLAATQRIEILLTLSDVGTTAINLTGNEFNNVLMGNDGANRLDGRGGADSMVGNGGNDVFVVDVAGDKVFEGASDGTDRVFAGLSYALAAGQSIETLSTLSDVSTAAINLTGNEFANTLIGNDGVNVLNGGRAADVMAGYGGNDSYFVDDLGDRVMFEGASDGTDRVFAGASYALTAGQRIETLSTTSDVSTTAINLTGNEFANVLIGNAGANRLNGGGAADVMAGYGGDDWYYVDVAGDKVVFEEGASDGIDRVYAGLNYTLAASQRIEILLTLSDVSTPAINLTGNEFNNVLMGNDGANRLDGRAGADSMVGNGGNDFFFVDSSGDKVFEGANDGIDRVFAGVSYTLAATQRIEALSTLSDVSTTAINLTGNEFANTLIANAGANVLNGGAGADVLASNGGNDVFLFNTAIGPSNIDTLYDFVVANDTVHLENAIFTQLTTPAGNTLSAAQFFTGAAAHDADDRIIYNSGTGALFYDSDGTGAAAAIQFAKAGTGLALTNGDFFVV